MRTPSYPYMQRIPSSQVLYYRSPTGPGNRMAYVMSFLFQLHGSNHAPYYFAYSFPYTYTDLQRYLYRWVDKNSSRLRELIFANSSVLVSRLSRRVHMSRLVVGASAVIHGSSTLGATEIMIIQAPLIISAVIVGDRDLSQRLQGSSCTFASSEQTSTPRG